MDLELIFEIEHDCKILDVIQRVLDDTMQKETVTFLDDAVLDEIVNYLKELVSKIALILESL